MEKPTTPAGPNATPQPEDSASEQNFGATGVFGVVRPPELAKPPEPVKKPEPARNPEPFREVVPPIQSYRVPEAAKPAPAPVQPTLPPEPVVHKVVFGGGAAASSPDLLTRMRMATAEKNPVQAQPAPAQPVPAVPAPPTAGATGGFTQLLRTLEIDRSSPAAPAPTPPAQSPLKEKGLTGLFETHSTPAPAEPPAQRSQPAHAPTPAVPPAVPDSGGFTEFFRAMPAGAPDSGPAQTPQGQAGWPPPAPPAPAANKPGTFTQLFSTLDSAAAPSRHEAVADWPAPPAPAPAANKPGSFTQLFSTLDGAASPPPPEPVDRGGSSPGSFTRMFSTEQQQTPAAPPYSPAPYYEERKPASGSIDYGTTPQNARRVESSRDPFAPAPLPEPSLQSAPPAGSVGITRLIRILDDPGTAPPPIPAAPVPPPRGAEPGIWTQTLASQVEPEKATAPAANAPAWTPPPPPPAAPAPPAVNYGAPSAAPATGPSEFTRILDASRMREMAMRGGQAPAVPAAPPAPPPQQSFALPAAPPMPSYQPPAPPPVGGMPGYGGYTPPAPQPPAYPMNYAPPAMAAPVPPPMRAPAPPTPAPPPQPAGGKLQQMVPILLIVAIVLLVVLIVTVIFVMKH